MITKRAAKWLPANTLNKGMIHVWGGKEQGSGRFHHDTQNSVHFKIYAYFLNFFYMFILYEVDWG